MNDTQWNKAVEQSRKLQIKEQKNKLRSQNQNKLHGLLVKNNTKRIANGFVLANGATLTIVSENQEKDIIIYKAKKFYSTLFGGFMKVLIISILLTLASCANTAKQNDPYIVHHADFEPWAGTTFTNVFEVRLNESITYLTFEEQSALVKDKKHEYIMCNKSQRIFEKEVFLINKSINCQE